MGARELAEKTIGDLTSASHRLDNEWCKERTVNAFQLLGICLVLVLFSEGGSLTDSGLCMMYVDEWRHNRHINH